MPDRAFTGRQVFKVRPVVTAGGERDKQLKGEVQVEEARVEDAPGIIAFIQEAAMEPGIGIATDPGEFQNTVDQEEAWIKSHQEAANSIILVASSEDGEIVGLLSCTGGRRRSMSHETTLGMTVKKEWRDKGVGTKMIQAALEWARGTGVVERVQLEVFTTNERAIHLYEKMGFEREGVRRRAFRKEGKPVDSIVMAVLL